MKRRILNTAVLLIFVGALIAMFFIAPGCSKDLYVPQPFQSVRLVGDTRATVTFPVRMADGSIQMVVTGYTLRDGTVCKELTPAESAAQQAALQADIQQAKK